MTQDEQEELAQYLGVSATDLKGPFWVWTVQCAGCGHNTHALDFVKTVVDSGRHQKQMIADVLTGKDGIWVAIAAPNADRTLKCARCATPFLAPIHIETETYVYL